MLRALSLCPASAVADAFVIGLMSAGRWDMVERATRDVTRRTRNGLAPSRYSTAMALIRVELLRIADRVLGVNAAPTREALVRILDVELAVMLT